VKKKKKRKHSSDAQSNQNDEVSNEDVSSQRDDDKPKPNVYKKKKKLEAPKGPIRWEDVNVESDRRYFDVSENIESGNSAVTSLTDVEPKSQ
jgi:hypothetical protein